VRGTQAPPRPRAGRWRISRCRPPTEGAERRLPEGSRRPRPARRWPGPPTGSARSEAPGRPPHRALRAWWSRPGHRFSRIPIDEGFARSGRGRSMGSTGGRRRRRMHRRRGPDGVPSPGGRPVPVATAGETGRSTTCQESRDWPPPRRRARLRWPARPRRRPPRTAPRCDGRGARATERHRPASATGRAAPAERAFRSATPLPSPGPRERCGRVGVPRFVPREGPRPQWAGRGYSSHPGGRFV
jgi:hypothetical protein